MGRKGNIEDRTGQVFIAIKKLWKEKSGSPTLREIGTEIHIKSTSLVSYYVDNLEDLGKIKRDENKGTRNFNYY